MVLLDNEVNTWIMNTEDIDISGSIIRFWVQEFDKENSTGWEGKLRINCKTYKRRAEIKTEESNLGARVVIGGYSNRPWGELIGDALGSAGGYEKTPWADIKEEAPNLLASNFCYLTGVEGYTPEPNPPEWVSKTIENYNTKSKRSSTGGVNCNSPVHSNKPHCIDY